MRDLVRRGAPFEKRHSPKLRPHLYTLTFRIMSSRRTRNSRRLEVIIPVAEQDAIGDVNPRPLGKPLRQSFVAHEPVPKAELDPNQRFNPDILLNIAEMLAEEEDYESVVNLSCTSRLIGGSLKPFLERVRTRLILKLDDLKLDETEGFSAIK